jgi:hypothetical protein
MGKHGPNEHTTNLLQLDVSIICTGISHAQPSYSSKPLSKRGGRVGVKGFQGRHWRTSQLGLDDQALEPLFYLVNNGCGSLVKRETPAPVLIR